MDCTRTWQWMMQALDGALPEDCERKMLIHLGGCRHCADMWARLQETALLLPETAEEPEEGIVSDIMRNLPEIAGRQREYPPSRFGLMAGLLMALGGVGMFVGLTSAESPGLFQFAASLVNMSITAFEGAYRISVLLFGERWQEAAGSAALATAVLILGFGAVAASLRMTHSENTENLGRAAGAAIHEGGMGR